MLATSAAFGRDKEWGWDQELITYAHQCTLKLHCKYNLKFFFTIMDCNFEFDFQGLDENRMKRMLGAQSLWDATMAHSVTKALYRSNLVVHIGTIHILHKHFYRTKLNLIT